MHGAQGSEERAGGRERQGLAPAPRRRLLPLLLLLLPLVFELDHGWELCRRLHVCALPPPLIPVLSRCAASSAANLSRSAICPWRDEWLTALLEANPTIGTMAPIHQHQHVSQAAHLSHQHFHRPLAASEGSAGRHWAMATAAIIPSDCCHEPTWAARARHEPAAACAAASEVRQRRVRGLEKEL